MSVLTITQKGYDSMQELIHQLTSELEQAVKERVQAEAKCAAKDAMLNDVLECCVSGKTNFLNPDAISSALSPDCCKGILERVDALEAEIIMLRVCNEQLVAGEQMMRVTANCLRQTNSKASERVKVLREALSGACGRLSGANISPMPFKNALNGGEITKPKTVCICGSTRFVDVMAVKAWELEKRGVMVLCPHLLPQWYAGVKEHHQAESEGVAHILDELHLRKIDVADEVFVVNVNSYIGQRTAVEIAYAKEHGKPVRYMEALSETEAK